MRVCFLIPTDLWEQPVMPGPYHRAMRQVQHLRAIGHEISVVSWIRWLDSPLARLPTEEWRDGLHVLRLVSEPPRTLYEQTGFFLGLQRAMAERVRVERPDALVVHDPELLPAGLTAGRRQPVFYDTHEHFPAMVARESRLKACLFDLLERSAVRRLAHVYAPSEGIALRFRRMGARTTVLRNAKAWSEVAAWIVPRPEARRVLGLADTDFVVGFHGSLSAGEGLELLLEALTLTRPNVRLHVHGGPSGERKRLEDRAGALGLAGRTTFSAPAPPAELYRLASGYDAAALLLPDRGPNYRFRAPNKLFDYLALALPVLTTPLPEPSRIVEEAGCGLVTAPEPKAVAASLERLLSDAALRVNLGEAGRRAFRERYCWERMETRLRASHPLWG